MSQFSNIKKGELHHAYLIKGAMDDVLKELHNFLERELKFPVKSNPDFWCGEFDTFGIDDGREIKEMQSRRPIVGELKIFIISANFFTTEAQNSLLKVFEEPTNGTHFFIITQNIDTLLPTLRSRLSTVNSSELFTETIQVQNMDTLVDIGEFLKSNKAKRATLLKDIIEDKNKNSAISFLNDLEIAIYQLGNPMSELGENMFVFEEIIKCKKYLNGRSPSVKMILEHVAFTVPQTR